jgi:hypothetical protein
MHERENYHFRWLHILVDEVEEEKGKPPQDDPAYLSPNLPVRQWRLGHSVQRIKKCRVQIKFQAGHTSRIPTHGIPDLTLYLWAEANRMERHLPGLESGLHLIPGNG